MKNITIILLLISTLKMNSQEEKNTMILNADQLAITVVNFRKQISQDNITTGTGSFISKDNKLYIVSASHVAKVMDSSSEIIIQGENNKPIKLYLTQLSNPVNWIHHKEADISILELNPSPEIITKYLQKRFIPYELIDIEKKAISRNTQLTIIGFPLGLGANEYFSPLTYRTFASSGLITLNRFDLKTPQTFVILENPSIGGYSGGPVYDLSIIESGNMRMTGSGTKLHGFIHGTLSDNTGGKLTAMTPSFYITDLIK